MNDQNPVLLTGTAGFIGTHVARRLLEKGHRVVGIDNLNTYYDPQLKEARLATLTQHSGFTFERIDIADSARMEQLFKDHAFPAVIHLAAQAGVRYSLTHPHEYAQSNLVGFLNVLEGCRHSGCGHLLYASSSSVYGANTRLPFSTGDVVDHPVSLYAATKKSNELMAHSYAHLYRMPCTGLRFFTVYGPWGRPDMAVWLFTEAILAGKPIRLFNNGQMRRDFTYVDDVADAVVTLLDHPATANLDWQGSNPDPATSSAPWRVYNIGNHEPVELMRLVKALEDATGKQALLTFEEMQPGDVPETYADIEDLTKLIGFHPKTAIEDGVRGFVNWFRNYHEL